MSDIKDLRAYARQRKLPKAILIGSVDTSWISSALEHCNTLGPGLYNAVSERNQSDIYGTEVNYQQIKNIYDQKKIPEFAIGLDPLINMFQGIDHLRYAILQPGSTIPAHIDSPYSLRFICMLQGNHTMEVEGDSHYMVEGQLWFVNGSYKHSIINNHSRVRIALLGNFSYNDYNVNILKKYI